MVTGKVDDAILPKEIILPTYRTAGRPGNALNGTILYNSDTAKLNARLNGSWVEITSA